MNENMARKSNLRNQKAGIFLKTRAGKLHRIMTQINTPSVPFKFDFHAIAEDKIYDVFHDELIRNLKRPSSGSVSV